MSDFEKINVIRETVARFGGFSVSQLDSRARYYRLALFRHFAMFLVHRNCMPNFVEIGNIFGGRDHTTVTYAISRRLNLEGRLAA